MDILVDIDGTIADCRHRRHFVCDGNGDWKSFFESMTEDPPIVPVINLVKDLADNLANNIILCTGRPMEYRRHTEMWLDRHRIYSSSHSGLWMRDKGDQRADYVVKEEMLKAIREQGYNPVLALDDNQNVVDMWRRNGILCLQNSMRNLP